MRVSITKTKNYEFIYIIKDFYNNESRTTKIIEKFGKLDELCNEKNMPHDEVIDLGQRLCRSIN